MLEEIVVDRFAPIDRPMVTKELNDALCIARRAVHANIGNGRYVGVVGYGSMSKVLSVASDNLTMIEERLKPFRLGEENVEVRKGTCTDMRSHHARSAAFEASTCSPSGVIAR